MDKKDLLEKVIATLSLDLKAKKDEACLCAERGEFGQAYEALAFSEGIEHCVRFLCNLHAML